MAIDAKCHISVIRDLLGRGIAKEEIAKAIAYVVQSQPKNPGGLLRSGKLFDENGRCIYVSDEAHYQRLLEKQNAELQAEEQVKAHWDIALAWYQGMQVQQQAEIRAMLNAWVKDTIWYRVPELRKRPWEIPGAKAQLVNMYLEYGNSRKK